jgi:hypothetical protein
MARGKHVKTGMRKLGKKAGYEPRPNTSFGKQLREAESAIDRRLDAANKSDLYKAQKKRGGKTVARKIGALTGNLRAAESLLDGETKRANQLRLQVQNREAHINSLIAKKGAGGKEAAKVIAKERATIGRMKTEAAQLEHRINNLGSTVSEQRRLIRAGEEEARGLRGNIENRKRVSKDRRDLTRAEHEGRTLAEKQVGELEGHIGLLEEELERERGRGGDTTLLEQRILSLETHITNLTTIIQEGRHINIGPDGRRLPNGVIYDGRTFFGPNGEAMTKNGRPMTFQEVMFDKLTPDEQRNVAKGAFGIKEEKKGEASEVAEKKKEGTEKFASDMKNINSGIGSFFNPGMMSNLFMVVAIVLLIYILMQFFPMI